ncbi:DUF3822 family protein [Pontibacter sp. MBLB2868]|uniref:DUF3822 family protein n=1 Tax=Pontibacter sp. MBLB2868 TaxID=3451555 RepID=UPI003F74E641
MNTIHTHFRLSHKIQDEAFELSQAGDCNLYLSLGQKSIRLAIVDLKRNKFVVLEDYELITVFSAVQVAEQLRLIASDNPLFKAVRWNSVRVSVSNTHFTLVPETLYDAAHKADYLRLHSQVDQQRDVVLAYSHSGIEAVNIFSVDVVLWQALQDIFPEQPVHFVHLTSALIRSVLHQVGRNTERQLCAFVERNYVTVLVVSPSGLEFCNTFHYLSPEDFIYYIIFVMQEQKLNPDRDAITVWGDITHDSTLFSTLQKYIRNIKLGKKPSDVEYSYKFHDLFEHRYFELYSLHLCE